MFLNFKCFFLILSVILCNILLKANGQSNIGLSTVIGDKRYFIGVAQKVNWYRAVHACTAIGMSLASIETASEQTNLRNYLYANAVLSNTYWLSGSDLATATEFTWLSNGNKFNYTKWASSQPVTTNHCVGTDSNFDWVTVACDTEVNYFICSRPVIPACGVNGGCSYNYNYYG